jgi:pyruvate-ferredoxin/flavodoxin oxidoreductase
MASALRPAMAVVALPALAPAGLRGLRMRAALAGRACVELVYDPDGGRSWADRLDLSGNPAPEAAWPRHPMDYTRGEAAERAEVAFTFADAVSIEPNYFKHFRVIDGAAWGDEQVPLADWIEDAGAAGAGRTVPFIWVVDDDKQLQRAIVTRELAFATRDRLRAWRVLQELGGYDNAYAERAAEQGHAEATRVAAEHIASLEAAHAAEVAKVRDETAREALERLAAVLMDADALAAVPAAARPPAAQAAPGSVAASPPPAAAAAAAAAPQAVAAAEEEELGFDEPYVDTVLCTSCNECINLNPVAFKYNGDKQATLADAKAATFLMLVKAAEACAAKCIHPGKPRGDDATATPELVERAKAFL